MGSWASLHWLNEVLSKLVVLMVHEVRSETLRLHVSTLCHLREYRSLYCVVPIGLKSHAAAVGRLSVRDMMEHIERSQSAF